MADENPASPPAPPGDGGKPPAPAPAPPKPAAPAAAKPAAPPKPKGPAASDASAHPVVARLKEALPDAVLSAKEFVGQVTVEVPAARIVDVCRHLKEREAFTYLVDLTAVDWKERQPRFDVVYWLHSFEKNNERIRLRTGVADAEACPTVSGVWLAANWMEREVFDLFGIVFSGHPDLRRILTWDGFQGHPLRKDFPVEGIDTGAAIYPDRYPDGGGPSPDDSNRKVVS